MVSRHDELRDYFAHDPVPMGAKGALDSALETLDVVDKYLLPLHQEEAIFARAARTNTNDLLQRARFIVLDEHSRVTALASAVRDVVPLGVPELTGDLLTDVRALTRAACDGARAMGTEARTLKAKVCDMADDVQRDRVALLRDVRATNSECEKHKQTALDCLERLRAAERHGEELQQRLHAAEERIHAIAAEKAAVQQELNELLIWASLQASQPHAAGGAGM